MFVGGVDGVIRRDREEDEDEKDKVVVVDIRLSRSW